MKKYAEKIDELYYSLGNFSKEFKLVLKSLDKEDQNIFIEELYESITLDGVNDKIKEETEKALKGGYSVYKFRYAKEDIEFATNAEKISGENLFKDEEDKLKYRATYEFHKRKKQEVYFATTEVEKLLESITDRVKIDSSISTVEDLNIKYKFQWEPLCFYEETLPKKVLNRFLIIEEFKSCFYSEADYNSFKKNSFSYSNKKGEFKYLDIPLVNGKKKDLEKKFYKLFVLVSELKNKYHEKAYNIKKARFAEVLMANFNDFRKNTIDEESFILDRKTTISRMR